MEKFEVPYNLSEENERKLLSLAVECHDKNLMLLSLIKILDENGENYNR